MGGQLRIWSKQLPFHCRQQEEIVLNRKSAVPFFTFALLAEVKEGCEKEVGNLNFLIPTPVPNIHRIVEVVIQKGTQLHAVGVSECCSPNRGLHYPSEILYVSAQK